MATYYLIYITFLIIFVSNNELNSYLISRFYQRNSQRGYLSSYHEIFNTRKKPFYKHRLYFSDSNKDDMNWDPQSAPKLDFDEDYYSVLEVPSNIDSKELKKAYYKIVFDYHPDRKKTENEKLICNRQMMVINNAYKILKDETTRKQYDLKRNLFNSSRATSSSTSTSSSSSSFSSTTQKRRYNKIYDDDIEIEDDNNDEPIYTSSQSSFNQNAFRTSFEQSSSFDSFRKKQEDYDAIYDETNSMTIEGIKVSCVINL